MPLGAFLSGGVDSSAVVAAMARAYGKDPVSTTTIGFSDKRYDEVEYARLVASRYRTDHKEFVVSPDAMEIIEDLIWHFDEPFADSSAIPTYYVSKLTRKRVTVALSGDGGDEVFAGYIRRYHGIKVEEEVRRRLPNLIRQGVITPISRVYPKWDFLPRPLRLKNFLTGISQSFERAYFRTMSFYFTPEMKRRFYRKGFSRALADFDAFEVLGQHFKKVRTQDPVTKAQYVDIMTYLPEDILVKVDRMSMANSLEVRAPILDHKVIELAATLPSKLKLSGNESKYIFKKMNEHALPREILYRNKQGFCIPLAPWLKNELRDLLCDTLFSPNSEISNYLDMTRVEALWKRHTRGIEDCSAPLWNMMMFELWARRFLRSS